VFIKEIHIKEFRHLKNVHLGPFSQSSNHSDLIILAGSNGSGKSSILELIGFALSNSWSLSWALRRTWDNPSFEIAISLSPNEIELVSKYIISTPSVKSQLGDAALEHLKSKGVYYRSFNYTDGEYQKNSALYNQIHGLVAAALRDHYNRSLGFFLKSDRFYPQESFKRDKIFNYQSTTTLQYIRNIAYNTSDVQYADMFDFLVQQRFHYQRQLGSYHIQKSKGEKAPDTPPSDPLEPYDNLLQELFPGYSFADRNEEIPTNLFIKIPSGKIIPFHDLSSGEKEVFFILSFFLRHDVNNAILVIDEPELHLHPELARLLIRAMLKIRPNNQLWIATHNAEVIDEAGRDKVIFVSRNPLTSESFVIPATDESEADMALREFIGYSGYIGIAKNMVFLEGLDSSSDRKMFSNLVKESPGLIKFIPSKSTGYLSSINTAILSILGNKLGWMNYYLIRDHDYLTTDMIEKYKNDTSGKMYVLKRYHIENYLLDDDIIAKVQTEIFGKPVSSSKVKEKLHSIAQKISAEILRDMIQFRLNVIYGPKDFSLGKFMESQSIIDQSGTPMSENISQFEQFIVTKTQEINKNLANEVTPENLSKLISHIVSEIQKALSDDGDNGWRTLFPGRRILEKYQMEEGLGKPPSFINSLIKEMGSSSKMPSELKDIIKKIESGTKLS
jgi:ABC-type lipoprotein export system ATPase subunit